MLKLTACAMIAIAGPVTFAGAVPTIVVGTHELRPNQPGQTVQIFVTGGDDVGGVNFYVQTANGGPEAEAQGWIPPGTAIVGPAITEFDLLTGTIFAGDNMGQFGGLPPGAFPQIALGGTVMNNGYVPANGLLATVTIDTTGFLSGSFALSLSVADVTTDFAGIPADITDGAIHIVADAEPPANQPPSASAGPDQTVNSGAAVQLAGSGSDPDGGPVTCGWTQTAGPTVTLSNTAIFNPTFTAPTVTAQAQLVFSLRVSDGTDERSDSVTITVRPAESPPGDDPPGDDGNPGDTTDPPGDSDDSTDDPPATPDDGNPDGDSGSDQTDDPPPSNPAKTGGFCGSGFVESAALSFLGLCLMPWAGRSGRRRNGCARPDDDGSK